MTSVYRQRFTSTGWTGLALAIACPAILSGAWLSAASSRAGVGDLSIALVVVLLAGAALGPALILVGREHYPVQPEAPTKPVAPGAW